jgi:diadenosine tetraphosphatase ApaH/serine/threonine PP2A family protein phosphatase
MQGGFRFQRHGVRHIQKMGARIMREEYELELESFYMINPGSVGQPRDGDPRAAWAIYAAQERLVIYRRTPYDIRAAQKKIMETGVPDILAKRLSAGR